MGFESPVELMMFAEEILLCLIGVLLILELYRRAYGKIAVSRQALCLQAAIAVAAAAILLKALLLPGRPAAPPPVAVLCSIWFLRYYPAAWNKKLLFSGTLLVISCLWLLLADILLTPLQIRSYLGLHALLHVSFWLLLALINSIGKYREMFIPFSLWLLLMGIAVSSAVVLYILTCFMASRDDPYAVTIEIPVLLVLLLVNVSLFVFFDRFSILISDAKEKAALERQLQMQEKHYRELDMAHRQIRAIQHDMKHYLRTAAQLASEQDNNAELLAFLDSTTGKINEIEQVVSTGNTYLDTVLNSKAAEMLREHIRVDIKTQVPPEMQISFEQAAVIFGNLLDNAKEACQKLPEEDRWVGIALNYVNHALFLRIENAANPPCYWNNGLPVSTKQDTAIHGLGLQNVKKIVEESGTFAMETTSRSFIVKIVLYDR